MGIGNRIAPARFIGFALAMIAASGMAVALGQPLGRALMLGFDVASAGFLLSLWPLLDDESDAMRRRATDNDANRAGLLALTAIVTLVVLVAVANELGGRTSVGEATLVIATLAIAWLFSNTAYALHYAHLFYSRDGARDAGGLDFPDGDEPDYWDFIYFAFTLGMTFQTSDVAIKSRRMRRVVTGHCLAAFVFNLGVIAFTINVLGN
ncbi:DUF1345 domain-containing protein [Sphingomonas radiodurans]|uniref:DUF1345 domain-containing protein n=1 Tax=Sphingomonas radiodurans TaxID=2890321 RepID=UPI001E637B6A|nr:DUF1345 domain-containing protein [Sphingomonas radiodurans]WBH15436.1 DUF1345 domain-containing protein [Sphingomonas radiodurans]